MRHSSINDIIESSIDSAVLEVLLKECIPMGHRAACCKDFKRKGGRLWSKRSILIGC